MSNITNYNFLFQGISRMPKINRNGSFQLSQLNSRFRAGAVKSISIPESSKDEMFELEPIFIAGFLEL